MTKTVSILPGFSQPLVWESSLDFTAPLVDSVSHRGFLSLPSGSWARASSCAFGEIETIYPCRRRIVYDWATSTSRGDDGVE